MERLIGNSRPASMVKTLQDIGWGVGDNSIWSPQRLIDFVSASFYRDYPGVYICFLNDQAELLRIELMAVGILNRIPFRDFLLAGRAQEFGATAIVIGYNDPAGAPIGETEIGKLQILARSLDEFGLSLIEIVSVSTKGLARYRLI